MVSSPRSSCPSPSARDRERHVSREIEERFSKRSLSHVLPLPASPALESRARHARDRSASHAGNSRALRACLRSACSNLFADRGREPSCFRAVTSPSAEAGSRRARTSSVARRHGSLVAAGDAAQHQVLPPARAGHGSGRSRREGSRWNRGSPGRDRARAHREAHPKLERR